MNAEDKIEEANKDNTISDNAVAKETGLPEKTEAAQGLYGWASSWISSIYPFNRSRSNSNASQEDKNDKVNKLVHFNI